MRLDPIYVAWFAGLYEGEGSVVCVESNRGSGRYCLRLQINMTDEDVIRSIIERTGCGTVSGPYLHASTGGNFVNPPKHPKPRWDWKVCKATDCLALIDSIMPLVGERRRSQIETALARFWTSPAIRRTAEERFRNKIEIVDDCHHWIGRVEDGYGAFWPGAECGPRRMLAHKFAWQLAGRAATQLLNVCGTKTCVNANHWVERYEGAA